MSEPAALPWNEERHARLLAGVDAVGRFQLEHFGAIDTERLAQKSSHSDLVTWVDTESERRLTRLLTELLPEAGLLGEEGARRESEGEFNWVLDPLDGTTNYAYQHPFFCISVALLRGREPVLGVIHAPRLGETWEGHAGAGARLEGRPLRVSERREGQRALFATGFADRRKIHARTNLGNLDRVLHASRGVRRAGSAALDLAFTAAGRLDGFWELGLNPWDVAAGIFLVRAAGGRISDFRGGEDAVSGRHIIASNSHLHDWLRARLELDPHFDQEPESGLGVWPR